MSLRPGITVQHSRDVVRDGQLVRSDVAGFISVIPKGRWPTGVNAGDFLELPLQSHADLLGSPARAYFDPVTRRAVQSFFENGGEEGKLFGLFVESEKDLLVEDPFASVFHALLERLRGEEDIGLLLMPLLGYLPVSFDRRGRATVHCQPVISLLLDHCREMNNRFLILDSPRDLHEEALIRWVGELRDANEESASYGAIYYPWLADGDDHLPPSGSMAGIFARSDREHGPIGVQYAPANQTVHGITHPAFEVKWRDVGALADAHINPILVQPSRGIVVWGARTLSRDSKWLHINARRIVSYITEQLRRDSEWVVFENQRPELWQILTRMVRSRLDHFWGAGLLTGDQAGSEYMVQCDAELNPSEVRDAGQVNVKVLLKPVSTAEYIVVDLRLGG